MNPQTTTTVRCLACNHWVGEGFFTSWRTHCPSCRALLQIDLTPDGGLLIKTLPKRPRRVIP